MDYSPYSSVTVMMSNLGSWMVWRSLETDVMMCTLQCYKIVYGLVAIAVPSYFERPEVYTHHTHPFTFRQIHNPVCYYLYCFFPNTVVLWNRFPADLVLNPDLDSFKAGVSKINHAHP